MPILLAAKMQHARRTMSRRFALLALAGTTVAGFVLFWRNYNRRLGAGVVNRVVNPFILGRGLSGGAHSELGAIEHVGRVTGTTRRTPVRPVPTADGFRIVVPLAGESQWARNVLAAGHCRLLWRGVVYELDEPQLVAPADCRDVLPPIRLLTSALGVQYMRLHRFADWPAGRAPRDTTPATAAVTEPGTPAAAEATPAGVH
jgi:deazaflavin-dependent oxidoreductase (nitroreductase family)